MIFMNGSKVNIFVFFFAWGFFWVVLNIICYGIPLIFALQSAQITYDVSQGIPFWAQPSQDPDLLLGSVKISGSPNLLIEVSDIAPVASVVRDQRIEHSWKVERCPYPQAFEKKSPAFAVQRNSTVRVDYNCVVKGSGYEGILITLEVACNYHSIPPSYDEKRDFTLFSTQFNPGRPQTISGLKVSSNAFCRIMVSTSSGPDFELDINATATASVLRYESKSKEVVDFARIPNNVWRPSSLHKHWVFKARGVAGDQVVRPFISGRYAYPKQLRYDFWEILFIIASGLFAWMAATGNLKFFFWRKHDPVLPQSQKSEQLKPQSASQQRQWLKENTKKIILGGAIFFSFLFAVSAVHEIVAQPTKYLIAGSNQVYHLEKDFKMKNAVLEISDGIDARISYIEPRVEIIAAQQKHAIRLSSGSIPYQAFTYDKLYGAAEFNVTVYRVPDSKEGKFYLQWSSFDTKSETQQLNPGSNQLHIPLRQHSRTYFSIFGDQEQSSATTIPVLINGKHHISTFGSGPDVKSCIRICEISEPATTFIVSAFNAIGSSPTFQLRSKELTWDGMLQYFLSPFIGPLVVFALWKFFSFALSGNLSNNESAMAVWRKTNNALKRDMNQSGFK